jgi:hypothetical protein
MNIVLIAAKSLFFYVTDETFAYIFWLSPSNINHYLQSILEVYIIYTIYLNIMININDWSEDQIFTKYHHVIGIVDCTELAINICKQTF